ncbi:hypothetical protein ACKRLN_05960 [Anaerococcus sp. DFU013_CI05]|uniref:hypothetical protein n=1 Tax=Anaerococcus sp. AH8042_DFU013_CI05 TaxID=3385202 RepID=UPI003A522AA5
MKRDYKFSSVFIINLIMIVIIAIISVILSQASADLEAMTISLSGIVSNILRTAVYVIFNFIIARGLISNRMGTVGEYFDNINHFNFKSFFLAFLISIILTLAIIIFATGIVASIVLSLATGNDPSGLGAGIGVFLLLILALIIYGVFISYQFFVIADNPNLTFGEMFKKVFKVGKDLFGKTIITFLKWIIVPVFLFIVILSAIFNGLDGTIAIGLILIILLAALVYVLIALTLVVGELSDHYLDYKSKTIDNNEKKVYESKGMNNI